MCCTAVIYKQQIPIQHLVKQCTIYYIKLKELIEPTGTVVSFSTGPAADALKVVLQLHVQYCGGLWPVQQLNSAKQCCIHPDPAEPGKIC